MLQNFILISYILISTVLQSRLWRGLGARNMILLVLASANACVGVGVAGTVGSGVAIVGAGVACDSYKFTVEQACGVQVATVAQPQF